MIFRAPKKRLDFNDFSLNLNNIPLRIKPAAKFLGITLRSQYFVFKTHSFSGKHRLYYCVENIFKDTAGACGGTEDEEYEEEDEPDRLKFSEDLTSIGVIGREVTEHALPTLSRLVGILGYLFIKLFFAVLFCI